MRILSLSVVQKFKVIQVFVGIPLRVRIKSVDGIWASQLQMIVSLVQILRIAPSLWRMGFISQIHPHEIVIQFLLGFIEVLMSVVDLFDDHRLL